MRFLRAKLRATYAAAFLAVALLAYAGVRSSVMQVEAASASATMPMDCPMGMSMDMGGTSGAQTAPGKAHAVCDFCVVAAQAPLPSTAPVLPVPSTVVWRCGSPLQGRSARGPPDFSPRARGPPISSLTV